MKLLKIWKNLGMRNIPRNNKMRYSLYINAVLIEKIKVSSTRSHHDTYKILREIKTPKYEEIFLFRNKKAFNTYDFIQNFDVIICGRNGVVLDLLTDIEPNMSSNYYKKSHYIYFTPVGTIKFYDLKIKDIFSVAKDWLK